MSECVTVLTYNKSQPYFGLGPDMSNRGRSEMGMIIF